MNIPYIGTVKSKFANPSNPTIMRDEESEIEIFDIFTEGLFKTELSCFIEVYYHFHKAEPYELKTFTYAGDYKGVFGTRSPRRPSQLGSTIVKLLGRENNILKVKGLDAIDGTPVVDIKPVHIPLTREELGENEIHSRKNNPRKLVLANIWAGKTERLLLDAGQIHGHFCTGLAIGVMMATQAMQLIRGNSDGLNELTAIAETNNCMLDAIQFVTGCTFGNKRLILNDYGNFAFTLSRPNGKRVRISVQNGATDFLTKAFPPFSYSAEMESNNKAENINIRKLSIEKAFELLSLDFNKLFIAQETFV